MTDPRISVVVPFYNNVDLLGPCLASIAVQTFADLEVIMVDDGSTDGSAVVARGWADADRRFRLVSVDNGGPGWARNHGVAAASGEYLAFVDADDLLPPDAYATMLSVLQQSGSDFVSGAVLRLGADGLGPSGLHDRAIKARRLRTHISATPELFYDISVWNKLFRKSFWDSRELRLPEGMLWEDLVAMTTAHVLAARVDVITDPIYHWRDRDVGAPSITQSRASISNFRDRITALRMIDDFLRDHGTPQMLVGHQHKALVNDLWLYVRDLPATGPDYQREFIALAAAYLGQVSQKVRRDLPAWHKLAYFLIEHGRQVELTELARWLAEQPGRTPPMVRRLGKLRADLPFRTRALGPRGDQVRVPAGVFRPQWRELDPYVRVDGISWRDDSLVIEGSAYVPSMDIGKRRHTSKLIALVPRSKSRLPLLLPARSVRRPDVTAGSGQSRYSYEWAGFRCAISPRWFRVAGRWLTGDWDCYVLVRGRASWRLARLHSPGPGAEHPPPRQVAPGLTFGARWAGRKLQVSLRRESPPPVPAARAGSARVGPQLARLTEQGWDDDGSLILRGQVPPAGTYVLELRHVGGWSRHVVPVTRFSLSGGDSDSDFSAAVPVDAVESFGQRQPLSDGEWELRLRPEGDQAPVAAKTPDQAAAGAAPLAAPGSGGIVADSRPVIIGRKRYRACVQDTGLLLSVGPVLRFADRGRIRRRLLRQFYYPVQRLLGVREAILFVSYGGKQCGDSPRGIADELRRRGDRRAHIWAVADWSVPVPAGARSVLIGTAGYFAALGRCAYLITNDHMPQPFRKRAGQRYVQTWHGTPLKRLGYDILKPSSASGRRYLDFLAADVAQWDLLISPNPFSTPIMRQAFRYGGEIAETGYPRNDGLVTGHATDEAGAAGSGAVEPGRVAEIRRRLGLPAGKRVAMYVPTWRDNLHDAAGRYLLDLRLDLAAAAQRLAGDFVLLIRGHHLMAGGIEGVAPGFALDVTGYPDINDLLLVTDVLITDYSSVMFDFAPTGRPMLFFTYDIEQYRDELRGFYFDFAAQAPGPLLATSDDVVDALADLDSVAARYEPAHSAFTARFCPLDDGKASARACDRIFGG